ncbi:hypothetical protein [Kitasatospora kifunensis]|uniref:Uncharacterized protein n=1 Tax=Kitasatospora kifunensis TaxID=58351 RepID=A0A7W7VTH3_KITKI|nr:hypothetical protein [Kitasatospora kifunensis]MBB4922242.1 hypothetical protein [Kitasatospora kifunensis]
MTAEHITPVTYEITTPGRTITGNATVFGSIEHRETVAALTQHHHLDLAEITVQLSTIAA